MAVSNQRVTVGNLTSRITLAPGWFITVWNQNVPFRTGTWFRLAPQLDPTDNGHGAAVEIADTNDAGGRGGEVVWWNDDGTQTPAITLVNRSTSAYVSFEINYLIAPG
jgi:hypothetical protein